MIHMEIINHKEISVKSLKKHLKNGEIIIYPTDTIYGLGCDANNEEAIIHLREVKQNFHSPLSIIPPSKKWVLDNTTIKQVYIDSLPGPFTFIVKLKKKNAINKEISDSGTIGIRIPDHQFIKKIQATKIPVVTTSVNLHGMDPITNLKQIPQNFKKEISIAIDAGSLQNNPSIILDLTGTFAKIIRL